MSDLESVFESEVTYYNPATKKWINGKFTLNKKNIQFVSDNKDSDQLHLCLPLSTISAIEKKLSSFIYASIVFTIGTEKHWFSSFHNRDSTYNMLELFWREELFMQQFKSPSPPKIATTDLGKELLSSLHESECILIETANALQDQNQQLENAQEAVESLNDDLNTLEANLKSANLVKAFVKIGSYKDSTSKEEVIKQIKRYKVMFSFSKTLENNNWEKGMLVISDDICLLNEDGLAEMNIIQDKLESFKVLSPWEVCITGYVSESKKTCFLMCPQLSRLLKCLSSSSLLKGKICFSDNNSNFDQEPCCSNSLGSTENSNSSGLCSNATKFITDASESAQDNALLKEGVQTKAGALDQCLIENCNSPDSFSNAANSKITQTSELVQDDVLSEEDAQAIAEALDTVQKLAAEVKSEEQKQLEKLDLLINDMSKTEVRLKANDKNFKKL